MTIRSTTHRASIIALVASLTALAPRLAEACAVCMSGRDDESRIAFEVATAFMTVTPLLMVGLVLWWLRRRLREVEAVHEAARSDDASALAGDRLIQPVASLES